MDECSTKKSKQHVNQWRFLAKATTTLIWKANNVVWSLVKKKVLKALGRGLIDQSSITKLLDVKAAARNNDNGPSCTWRVRRAVRSSRLAPKIKARAAKPEVQARKVLVLRSTCLDLCSGSSWMSTHVRQIPKRVVGLRKSFPGRRGRHRGGASLSAT